MTFRGLWLLGWVALAACASRSTPASHPENAASSTQVPESKLANVTHSLAGDPPMPGEPSQGWTGLADAATTDPAQPGPTPSPSPDTTPTPAVPAHGSHGGHHHHGAH